MDIKTISSNAALAKILETKGAAFAAKFLAAAELMLQGPDIKSCTGASVIGSLIRAASLGFVVSEQLGYCYITPRKSAATFNIGYQGWRELAFRSGSIESMDYNTVRQNDPFKIQQGTSPVLQHNPAGSNIQRGERVGVWASATMKSGRVVFHYCPTDEIKRHEQLSASKHIWTQHPDMMAAKVAIMYLCKHKLPKSEEMQEAFDADGAVLNNSGHVEIGAVEQIRQEEAEGAYHDDWNIIIESAATKSALRQIFASAKEAGFTQKQLAEMSEKMAEIVKTKNLPE